MKTIAALAPFFVLGIRAQSSYHGIVASTGPFLASGLGDGTQAQKAAAAAGRHPNATSSITFNHAYNGTLEHWSWRINITDIPVPNNPNNYGDPSADFSDHDHVVNQQWELQWPGAPNQTLLSFMNARHGTIYFNTIQYSIPSNLSSAYKDSGHGSCSSVLGNECSASLLDAVGKAGLSAVDTSGLHGCQSTLDVAKFLNGVGFRGAPGSLPGDTLAFATSRTLPPTDQTTTLRKFESSLQVLTMFFAYRNSENGYTPDSGPVVFCQIVENSAVNSTNTQSGASPTHTKSAAADWQRPEAVLWGMLFLSLLIVL